MLDIVSFKQILEEKKKKKGVGGGRGFLSTCNYAIKSKQSPYRNRSLEKVIETKQQDTLQNKRQ
jgi:hypothetical protein